MKYKFETMQNPRTGDAKQIVVKSGITRKDLPGFIGGIAGVLGGIYLVVRTAFHSGAVAYDEAEFKTMQDINLVTMNDEHGKATIGETDWHNPN